MKLCNICVCLRVSVCVHTCTGRAGLYTCVRTYISTPRDLDESAGSIISKADPGGGHRGHVPPFSFPNYILIFK